MKINISRQSMYLLILSIFLLIFVLVFAFALLIPEGKEYRNKRVNLKKENKVLRKYNNFRTDVSEKLADLKTKNRNIITALNRKFDLDRFEKQHKDYFNSLKVSSKIAVENMNGFSEYEVKTISKINSPKSFYNFLDAINKSDWIISINFPIHFKRENEIIISSFTMKVYEVQKDTNITQLNMRE
jgi:hypothetical protein